MTNLTATQISTVTRKAESARTSLHNIKSAAATLAFEASGMTADKWAAFANSVAHAEGVVAAWDRIEQMVTYKVNNGEEALEQDIMTMAATMMMNGADDEWSGRGNDVKRARFDGLRSAVQDMRWV